jgi:Putative restriction endonuclease
MRTFVLGPPPAELQALIARRHSLGLDGFDEVWKGEYHMATMAHPFHGYLYDTVTVLLDPLVKGAGLISTAAFNLGQPDDFRVPDGGLHHALPTTVYVPTAAAVIEIESPDDETWDKLGFYAEQGVSEVLIVSYLSRSVTWLGLAASGRYETLDHSRLLGEGSADLQTKIDWPTADPGPAQTPTGRPPQ